MKRCLPVLTLALLLAAVVIAGCGGDGKGALNPDNPSALVTEVKQTVEHQEVGEKDWEKTEQGQLMVPGEQVRTGEKSKVILELSDATLTTVGPDSQLAIEEIVPLESEEGFTAFETVVRVVQGLGLFEIKDSKNARSFSVKTPYAVVVHRGTVFTVEVAHDGGARVVVKSGEVEVTAAGQSVTVGPSQATLVLANMPPTQPETVNIINEPGFIMNYRVLENYRRRSSFSND